MKPFWILDFGFWIGALAKLASLASNIRVAQSVNLKSEI
jgi:hypothetical protein